ncbi:hypothetical protein HBI56_147900 [Parastagonospora nodorum]|uniref:Uncharacterized protein n=1 Tax=Phaeosphaeria nodorum (strain SN15 / ATCC MYA-4574 / FGSC 10173) TaxID=321614 RepID=A0A7U2IBU7_PHANO|nr:hypothetical protein HBH56_076950 [Parastagonospora nodorum]QRD06921.1 hypothetical protein JI435_446560 [Parastagonospora nodorum SN15]KAH3923418.1 hypothetical protein HBH54_211000 [Parastagonospora nodorum]KAH3952238.1 hypothetical protein HBH53_051170 [Parastagonospora nodorum]KAH3981959.1 hypothetical protein HBH51_043900 [Parastagonospora nodorum]
MYAPHRVYTTVCFGYWLYMHEDTDEEGHEQCPSNKASEMQPQLVLIPNRNAVSEYTPRAGRGRLTTVPPGAYVGVENGNIPERYAHSKRNTSPHRKPPSVHVVLYGQ